MSSSRSSFSDTLHHALDQLRAAFNKTVDMPPTGKMEGMDVVDPALQPIEKELTIALDQLKAFANDDKNKDLHAKELREAREILGHVDSLYHEGKFTVEGVGIPPGQAKLASMLSQGYELLRTCLERVNFYHVAPELRQYHDKCQNVIHALEGLKESKKELKPADLRLYRNKLAEVDFAYHDARFEVNNEFPEGQAVLSAELARGHELLRELLLKTDYYKVDAALLSLHDRLDSMKARLEGLMSKENVTEKDLRSLRDKLANVDEEWKEGRIEIEGRVPEGQAVISKLLYETHNLMSSVQNKVTG